MEFFLAERLRMPVARMRREMSQQEFATWCVYYAIQAQRAQLHRDMAGG